jgi:hypothetical protein
MYYKPSSTPTGKPSSTSILLRFKETNGKMFLYGMESLKAYSTRIDMVESFPHHLITNEENKTVLVYLAYCDASGWMNELIGYILKGRCTQSQN